MSAPPFHVTPDDLSDAAVVALLEAHVAQLRAISPPGSAHVLDVDALRAPGVRFWVARSSSSSASSAGRVLGCGALKTLDTTHGEVKSMRTAPEATGQGVASAILAVIIAAARADGLIRLSLETGSAEFFAPARRLYQRHGFVECGPFAGYGPDPESTFLTLDLRGREA